MHETALSKMAFLEPSIFNYPQEVRFRPASSNFLKNKTKNKLVLPYVLFFFGRGCGQSQIFIQNPLDHFLNGTFFSKRVIDGNSLFIYKRSVGWQIHVLFFSFLFWHVCSDHWLESMAHSKNRATDGKITYPPGVKEISDKISKEEMVRRLKVRNNLSFIKVETVWLLGKIYIFFP